MNPTEKIDITERVYGKLTNGEMALYADETQIGQYNGKNEVNLLPGYEYSQDRFFETIESTVKPGEQYVDHCEDGWC
ncbi:DUF2553 family protein [Bacillus sp. Marseille-P3661]|uniref:DUF2553 family protein n=1 Tax=Bacillus sp. Marseille-P3661 TaxID=1936234 RepID=UPI0015E16792|nr:DUF2553 family protein [Bacillus sp. Marseille-P3661]